jgi:hypothetical protein
MKSLIYYKFKLQTAKTTAIYFLIFFLFNAGLLFAQTGKQQLYISMGDLGPTSKSFLSAAGVKNVFTIGIEGNSFDQLNIQKITAAVKSRYPADSDSGLCALDWEGSELDILKSSPSESPEFKSALNSYIMLLKMVKSLRPNVKWGYYSVPFTTYYKRENLKNTNDKIEPLLAKCDAFFPSTYIYYKEGTVSKGDNEAYAKDNVLTALMLAKNMNKPVYPFVWHRYHVSNKTIGLQLIPIDDFTKYINTILSVSYNGYKVAGVVWWGSDTYYYNVKSKALVEEMSKTNQPDFASYRDDLIIKYGKEILKTVSDNNR